MDQQPQTRTTRRGRRGRRDADRQLERIIGSVADAIVVVDEAGFVQFANPAAEDLLRRGGALVGTQFGFPVSDGETAELDLVGGRAAEMRVVELTWAGGPAWLASLRDVTQRREAEDAARRLWRERTAREEAEKERRRLQSLLQRAPAGILTTRGPEHVCAFANPVMRRLAGGRELAGRPLGEALPELVGSPFLRALDEVLGRGVSRTETELEVVLRTGDGEELRRVLDVCWEPLAGEDGRVEGVMCFAHDVTDQVALLRELERAMEALREDERQKDHFMAMLGHELRNPLAGIDSGLRLLELGADRDQAAWAIGMMRKQVSQLTTLLDDLLDVARVTRGKLELQRRLVRVSEVVESAIAAVAARLEDQRQTLVARLPEESLAVAGDPARLEQVLTNLLVNASRYSPPHTEIHLRACRDDGAVTLEVADQGMGIEPEMLARIFDPFVQASASNQRAGGLGIGLTLVKQLAELHGGSVSAHSDGPGKGSTFRVRLPLAEPAVPDLVASSRSPAAATTRCRVLLIDDNEDAGRALAELLALHGCETRVALTARDGLAAASEQRPDVVLLDLDLPDAPGYDVAEELRRRPELAGLLIIAVSGFGDEASREHSRRCGIDHHMLKPVDLAELVRLMDERGGARS